MPRSNDPDEVLREIEHIAELASLQARKLAEVTPLELCAQMADDAARLGDESDDENVRTFAYILGVLALVVGQARADLDRLNGRTGDDGR